MTDHNPLAALERLGEIEARHEPRKHYPIQASDGYIEWCDVCNRESPCDAIQLARAVRAQEQMAKFGAAMLKAHQDYDGTGGPNDYYLDEYNVQEVAIACGLLERIEIPEEGCGAACNCDPLEYDYCVRPTTAGQLALALAAAAPSREGEA